jgi:hypothetical protein
LIESRAVRFALGILEYNSFIRPEKCGKIMKSVVCTLFEGHYHYGVGALANSLYAQGFRGTIYVGYRGSLPPWVGNVSANCKPTEYTPLEGLTLQFVSLTTKVHLTNFKPDFMLSLWQERCPDADALFYFDPDIVIRCRWQFFEEWVQGGVGLCEDVNSPMPSSHPIRNAWREYYKQFGRKLDNPLGIYINGGFIGVKSEQRSFLQEWYQIQQEMSPAAENMMDWSIQDRTFKFCKTDQDALNIAAMATEVPLSVIGQDGMDFQYGGGGYVMSHAIGGGKPWRKKMLVHAILKASGPSRADRAFYSFAQHPIRLFSPGSLLLRKLDLKLAAAIGRYIK